MYKNCVLGVYKGLLSTDVLIVNSCNYYSNCHKMPVMKKYMVCNTYSVIYFHIYEIFVSSNQNNG